VSSALLAPLPARLRISGVYPLFMLLATSCRPLSLFGCLLGSAFALALGLLDTPDV
jgi:hypothetical protein